MSPASTSQRIRIIGGGLTGVLAAFEAHRLGWRDITLQERFEALGGVARPKLIHGREMRDGVRLRLSHPREHERAVRLPAFW